MSDEKKTRRMSIKRFIKGPPGKMSVEGFLQGHREWLQEHTFLAPILTAYEDGLLFPTPTLAALQSALVDHLLVKESRAAQAKMQAAEEEADGPSAPYTVSLMVKVVDSIGVEEIVLGTVETVVAYRILTQEGPKWVETQEETDGYHVMEKRVEVSDAVWGAQTFGEASNLADRRLFAREDSVHAVIVNTQGVPIETMVSRTDAVARILRAKKQPVGRRGGTSTSTLKWVGRAKQDRSSFSRG